MKYIIAFITLISICHGSESYYVKLAKYYQQPKTKEDIASQKKQGYPAGGTIQNDTKRKGAYTFTFLNGTGKPNKPQYIFDYAESKFLVEDEYITLRGDENEKFLKGYKVNIPKIGTVQLFSGRSLIDSKPISELIHYSGNRISYIQYLAKM
jgi:hypothetical protein